MVFIIFQTLYQIIFNFRVIDNCTEPPNNNNNNSLNSSSQLSTELDSSKGKYKQTKY